MNNTDTITLIALIRENVKELTTKRISFKRQRISRRVKILAENSYRIGQTTLSQNPKERVITAKTIRIGPIGVKHDYEKQFVIEFDAV
jgi:hypothetical protein